MAKSFKRDYEEIEREEESPSHRTRRAVTQLLREYAALDHDEDEEDEIENFERIRPKHQKKR